MKAPKFQFPANISTRTFPSGSSEAEAAQATVPKLKIPSDSSLAKDVKRKSQRQIFQTDVSKRSSVNELSQAKDPNRNETSQTEVPKRQIPSESYQAKVPKRTFPSEMVSDILVRVKLV